MPYFLQKSTLLLLFFYGLFGFSLCNKTSDSFYNFTHRLYELRDEYITNLTEMHHSELNLIDAAALNIDLYVKGMLDCAIEQGITIPEIGYKYFYECASAIPEQNAMSGFVEQAYDRIDNEIRKANKSLNSCNPKNTATYQTCIDKVVSNFPKVIEQVEKDFGAVSEKDYVFRVNLQHTLNTCISARKTDFIINAIKANVDISQCPY